MTDDANSPDAQIRALIERQIAAIQAKDVSALLADTAPEAVVFDALPPLRKVGAAERRDATEAWFGSYATPIRFEMRDLHIVAGDDVAFAYYLYRVRGTLNEGAAVDMWVRMTNGFERHDGAWRITHEHTSVPFDAATGKARLDLTP